jgi:hypothetical protein
MKNKINSSLLSFVQYIIAYIDITSLYQFTKSEIHKICGSLCVETNKRYIKHKMKILCVHKSAILSNFSSNKAF